MGKIIDKLSDPTIKNAKPKEKPYKLADGNGLYLEVMPNGSKYWRMKYRFAGKEKRLAFGVYPEVTLKLARNDASQAREKIRNNIDPGETKKQTKLTQLMTASSSFESLSEEWLFKNQAQWSESHVKRIRIILKNNLNPWIGHRPIELITQPELRDVLQRTEDKGTFETARRANQIAGRVLTFAKQSGRNVENFTKDISALLTKSKTEHFSSITKPDGVGKLLIAMDSYHGTPAVKTALLLSPLFFCRQGELRHLEWSEVNFSEARIEIPKEKMKSRNQDHIIPLSTQAIQLLRDIQPLTGKGKYVFPSARGASRPISDNTVRIALRSLGYDKETMTPHGFRAMARTMLDEVLGYRIDWIEHQLAHDVRDANGRAYNRTAHLPGRKEMMQGWADYLDKLRIEARSVHATSSR